MEKSDLVKAFEEATSFGFVVMPLNGKKPIGNGWTKLTLKDNDIKKFQAGNNMGVVTGSKSGVFVVDIDAKDTEGKFNGMRCWQELLDENNGGRPLGTPTVQTGSGGLHVYFQYESRVANIKSGTDKIKHKGMAATIDIRSNGGQVVYPPSIHPTTNKEYFWLMNPSNLGGFLPVPGWLLEKLTENQKVTGLKMENEQLSDRSVSDILMLFKRELPEDAKQFALRGTAAGKIQLDRISAGHCSVCQRTHGDGTSKGDNAFISFSTSGKQAIIFHCHENHRKLAVLKPQNLDVSVREYLGSDDKLAELCKFIWEKELFYAGKKVYYQWDKVKKLWVEKNDNDVMAMIPGSLRTHLTKERDHWTFVYPMKTMPEWKEHWKLRKRLILPEDSAGLSELEISKKVREEFSSWKKTNSEQYLKFLKEDKDADSTIKLVDNTLKRLTTNVGPKSIETYLRSLVKDSDFEEKLNHHNQLHLVPIGGGKVFDIKTKNVRDRTIEDYFTFAIEYEYKPEATSSLLENFFRDLMLNQEEMVKFLKKMIGLAIRGENELQILLILNNQFGSNGKSTLLLILELLLGNFYANIAKDALLTGAKSLNVALMQAKNRRLATITELDQGDAIDNGIMKNVTGGEGQKVRNNHTK